MPYLIQLHCDGMMPDGHPAMERASDCLSYQCVQPTAMYEDANRAAAEVRQEARGTGWSYERNRWLCPECFKRNRDTMPVNLGGYRHGLRRAAAPAPRDGEAS